MRIAFLGKGGSGKTTLSAAMIQFLSKTSPVLAIDADLNVNLADNLMFSTKPLSLGEYSHEIATYLKGNRTDVNNVVATTPPSLQSKFIIPSKNDDFIRKYGVDKGNISLISVGTYLEKDIGRTCYHGKLNVLEMVYHHLLDTEKDVVIADATAGVDNLGVSLYFCYDVNFLVVEPTIKSISVYMDYKKKAEEFGIEVCAIANKVRNPDDLAFIKKHIPEISAIFPKSGNLVKFEQGDEGAFGRFVEENREQLQLLKEKMQMHSKNWKKYYESLLKTHKQNSLEFWDDYYKEKISDQKDEAFSYEKAIEVKKNDL